MSENYKSPFTITEKITNLVIEIAEPTGHYWYLHNTEYPSEESCIIFHKHKASHPYHRHGKSKNLRQAIRSIKGHDAFQMNGRKYI